MADATLTHQPSTPDARLPAPGQVVPGEVRWRYASVLIALHVLALLALIPWLFSWTGVIIMVIGVHLFGQAINLCYHRLLAHKSAKVPKWLEHFFVIIALCCLEETPAKWVAIHRYHHQHSDHQEDPHSPLVTFLWSHVLWMVIVNKRLYEYTLYARYAPDLLKDRFYMKLEKRRNYTRNVYLIHASLYLIAGFAIGWATSGLLMEGVRFGLSLLVWGVFVRTVAVWHITWSVNSLTHLFGYTNHETTDHSRNNWLVALFSVGEGWHNNHHADPISASNQHRWWEFDLTYYEIRLLQLVGLARDVKPPKHIRHAGRTTAPDAITEPKPDAAQPAFDTAHERDPVST